MLTFKNITMKTAAEWLAKELESYGNPQFCEIEWKELDLLIAQAKEMEKQQIVKAVYDSMGTNCDPNMGRAEQYYNETFKNK
jgi:hypothetical protein